jgi:hypothetical protein
MLQRAWRNAGLFSHQLRSDSFGLADPPVALTKRWGRGRGSGTVSADSGAASSFSTVVWSFCDADA